MNTAPEKSISYRLRDQLVVLGTEDMMTVLNGASDREDGTNGFTDDDIGAIIHLDYHDATAPGVKLLPGMELPQTLRDLPKKSYYAAIKNHFSELFYSGLHFNKIASPDSVKDVIDQNAQGMRKAAEIGTLLDIKRQDLYEAIEFGRNFLDGNDKKKCFIYVTCGNLWAPLIATAIIASYLGEGKEKEAFTILRDVCPFERPRFLEGQMAFLDHAMNRGGKLIDAWIEVDVARRFDGAEARRCYQVFDIAANVYYGPRRGHQALRHQLATFNPR